MRYHFKVHEERDGLWAECTELPGCRTQAETRDELPAACEESLNLYLEEPQDSKVVFPLPDEVLDADPSFLGIEVEPELALAVLLRFYRHSSRLTQKQIAEMLGMKNIYSYQRLEKRSNPTLSLIKKIHQIFPAINLGRIIG
ncbi:MAG: type II toxin-antitoxin system HicB family antitoxin [Spirochaetia bacterium]|jgi:predicted RNase H-like HicB family nuclease/DNA-binding XRE family transcriptional regulator|nr:type II toxin-antitoxin system HicB family antitoxin [Spirochaetia bacterium]